MNILRKLFGKRDDFLFCGEEVYIDKNIFLLFNEKEELKVELKNLLETNYNKKDLKGTIRKSLEEFNKKYFEKRNEISFLLGIKEEDRFYIGHSGNYRFYLKRDKEISLITSDFTKGYELFNNGLIEFENLIKFESASFLTAGLFLKKELELNIYDFCIKEKDMLLFINWQGIIEDKIKEIFEEEIKLERGSYLLYNF